MILKLHISAIPREIFGIEVPYPERVSPVK